MSGVSWPTVIASAGATLIVGLLLIIFGEPLKRWVLRRFDRSDRSKTGQISALDEYIGELRKVATACRAVGSFTPRMTQFFNVATINPPGPDDAEALLRVALRSLQGLAVYIAGHVLRLPLELRARASALPAEINKTAGVAMLALAENHGVQTYHAVPAVAGFSTTLESAAVDAEAVRANVIGR
jgi:hypothetical protein